MQKPREGIAVIRQTLQSYFRAQTLRLYVKNIFRFLNSYLQVHQSIIWLTIFILLTNILVVRASNEIPTVSAAEPISSPYDIADTVRILAPYTSDINEDPDQISTNLEERVNGSFVKTNPLVATEPSQSDVPVTSTPAGSPNTNAPTNRTRDIKYNVEIGDTLSGIGSKFDLKVATLKVKNNLTDVDSITPGQDLIIPVDDLSDKAIQAAKDRAIASKNFSKTGKDTKIISNAAHAGGYGFVVPIHYTVIARRLVGGHTGIDYDAPVGTTVIAAASGSVIVADSFGWNGGYGKTILIDVGGGKTLRYGHLSSVQVSAGQHVAQGQVIALSGNSGRSTGPHLHFELRVNGRAVDPGT